MARSAVGSVNARMDRSRGLISGAVVLGALAYLCAFGLLAVAAWLIARASQQPPVLTLSVAAVSVRAFAIGRSCFRYAERLVGHDGAFRGLGSLRVQLYSKVEQMGPARTRTLGRGDLLQRMVGDVDGMQDFPLRVVLPWAQAVVVGLASVMVAWWLLPWAGVAMLVGLVLAATAVPALAMKVAADSDRAVANARGRLAAGVLAALQASVDLRSIGAAERATASLAHVDGELVDVQLRSSRGGGVAAGLLAFLQGGVVVASAVAGVAGVTSGQLEGVLLAVVVLLPLAAFEASLSLPTAALVLRRVQASAERLVEILDAPTPPVLPPAADLPSAADAALLTLRHAKVRWPGAAQDALHGVTLSVRRGERVAIVGRSGSGKSTLAAALARFLDVSGDYRIDDVDATHASADGVRCLVGLLGQEAHVFDTTLEQNLRLVRPDIDDADLADVMRRVHLDEWVRDLPRGMDEAMGEGGVRMSGGQRQRIGLARMLLADFPWMVLDEPTENLDVETAGALMQDVFEASRGRGLVLITHRMSDAMQCDRVVVMDEGQVVAEGEPGTVQAESAWFADGLRLEREQQEWQELMASMPIGQIVLLNRES